MCIRFTYAQQQQEKLFLLENFFHLLGLLLKVIIYRRASPFILIAQCSWTGQVDPRTAVKTQFSLPRSLFTLLSNASRLKFNKNDLIFSFFGRIVPYLV